MFNSNCKQSLICMTFLFYTISYHKMVLNAHEFLLIKSRSFLGQKKEKFFFSYFRFSHLHCHIHVVTSWSVVCIYFCWIKSRRWTKGNFLDIISFHFLFWESCLMMIALVMCEICEIRESDGWIDRNRFALIKFL